MEDTTPLVSFVNDTHIKDKNYLDTENDLQGNKSHIYEEIGIMAIYSMFYLLGIIGNGLVIWFAIFRMKKTVNVVWFLNLAIADFTFVLFLPLNYTLSIFKFQGFENICKLVYYLTNVNLSVSIFQLTFISIDRCISVVFPVWCHNHRRPRLAFIIVLIIWTYSLAVAMVTILYSNITNINGRMLCAVDRENYILKLKTIFDFVIEFLLPFIIIASCYIMIILHIRRKRIITSSRPLKTSVAVITAFFICWFPYHLFSFVHIFEPNVIDDDYIRLYLYVTSFLLIVVSSCINPILYVFIGRDFKEKFCGSFQLKLKKAFIEEDMLAFEKEKRHPALQRSHQDNKEKSEVIFIKNTI